MAGVSSELAAWANHLRWTDAPESIREQTREIWLDTFGCMLLGAAHPETEALAATLGERGLGARAASAVGPVSTLAPHDAVLVNALATGVDVFDGGNVASRGHVAGYVMPAALTAAEQVGASFEEALCAFLAGYEIAARVGAASRLRAGLHPSGTFGVVGATAAVARLYGLSSEKTADAMDLAANLALAPSWNAAEHGASVRSLYSAMPSAMAMTVLDLARSGFRGGPNAIEVTFGTLLGETFDPAKCVAGLGESWLLNMTYMKRYPCCRNFHAVLDGIFDMIADAQAPSPETAHEIRVGADPIAYRDNTAVHYGTALAAKESLPVNVALALLRRKLTPAMYVAEQAYADPAVVDLANKVKVEEARRRDDAERPGWIEIIVDGKVKERRFVSTPLGDPGNRLSVAELREKFLRNAGAVLGPDAPTVADEMLSGDVARPFAPAFRRWLGLNRQDETASIAGQIS